MATAMGLSFVSDATPGQARPTRAEVLAGVTHARGEVEVRCGLS